MALSLVCAHLLAAAVVTAIAAARSPPSDGEITVSPPYTIDAALTNLGAPRGTFFNLTLTTASSPFFNGSDATFVGTACDGPTPAECCHKAPPTNHRCAINARRGVFVYVPRSYVDGDALPLLVMLDGPGYLAETAYALDTTLWATRGDRCPPSSPCPLKTGAATPLAASAGWSTTR